MRAKIVRINWKFKNAFNSVFIGMVPAVVWRYQNPAA
jgi:hypothetical protein